MTEPEPLSAADIERVADRLDAVKASAFVAIPRELLDGMQHMATGFERVLREALDPNRVPPKPWEGEPVTPKPVGYGRLLDAVRTNVAAGLLTAIVEMHRPEPWLVHPDGTVNRWECQGCDAAGYDWEHPDWPCRTSELIAQRLGVDLAEVA